MDILSTSEIIEVFDSPFVLMRVSRVYFLSTLSYRTSSIDFGF